MAEQESGGLAQQAKGITSQLPTDALKRELGEFAKVAGKRGLRALRGGLGAAGQKVRGAVTGAGKKAVEDGGGMVTDAAKKVAGEGVSGVKDKVKESLGGGGGGGSGDGKVTNIVEEIDVGVPVDVAYDQWTRFTDFPSFMKKVEKVEQESDTELSWRAQILWSHRDWKATITDQVPPERIVWRSEGAKGYVNGAVTFHEIAPNLTKILVVLEYYPQGLFEKTGNLWRAQGRRARLELKHFRRFVMTNTLLHPDEVEGWRGVIHDSEVQPEESDQESEDSERDEEDYDEEG
jgi:uncharacterized membrane protein